MESDCLTNLVSPQLCKIHSGKVRESFRLDAERRLIVTTDRISAFDHILETPIPHKGAVLNGLSAFWFERTRHIVPNHLLSLVDPNVALVRETVPLKVEVILRGYMTGSTWRAYQQGKRTFSGVRLPDGIGNRQRFPEPLLTPTTKELEDEEITAEEIVERGLCPAEIWRRIEKTARELFRFGGELAARQGLLLVDTKYEFGLIGSELVLIDEMHTPDSSRYWEEEAYRKDPETVEAMDKELVRAWLLSHRSGGAMPRSLPPEVIEETSRRYLDLYRRLTGQDPSWTEQGPIEPRVRHNLVTAGLIRDGYVLVAMGSPADREFALSLKAEIERYGVKTDLRVVSAHKDGEDLAEMARQYNGSIEPGAAIAVAGLSNGLGGALAANLDIPVFNCPPFRDAADLQLNVFSSLMMPSKVPAATVLRPDNAVGAALRSLNLPRLRTAFREEIARTKESLRQADREIRGCSDA